MTVRNGDIQLTGGKIQFSVGFSKLVQDIARWLEEPLGTGYTTPSFGSTLQSMVGGSQNSTAVSAAQNEIQRVLQLYQGQQILNLQKAQSAGQLANWNKNEIINSIDSVSVTADNTSLIANVIVTTLANTNIQLNVFVNNNGVSVSNG